MNRRGFFSVLAGLLGWGAVSTRGLATPSPQPRCLTFNVQEGFVWKAIIPDEIRALRGRKPYGESLSPAVAKDWPGAFSQERLEEVLREKV